MKGDGGKPRLLSGTASVGTFHRGGAGFAFEEELIKKTVDYLCFHDPVCKFNEGPGLI